MNYHYDTLVVGARCAGASTAMLLARMGLKVLAVDRAPAGSDTMSTHALMRGGVLQLLRWGLLPRVEASGAPPVHSTTFHYGDEAIEVAIKPRDGCDALFAPRRTVLDPLLVEAARAEGAEVVHGVSAVDLIRDRGGRVRGAVLRWNDGALVRVTADLVIGADGLRSAVARLVGADVEHAGCHATAVIYGYFAGLPPRGFHWHYNAGVSVGVIPTNDGQTCVFAALPSGRFRAQGQAGLAAQHREILHQASPALARLVEQGTIAGKYWSFPGVRGFIRRSRGRGWALVGDAGFFRDPITAHGITDALRDAELLARAVARGSDRALANYQAVRDVLAQGMLDLSDEIASYEWRLERVKVLHLELSRLMNAGVEVIRSWGPLPVRGAASESRAACPLSFSVDAAPAAERNLR